MVSTATPFGMHKSLRSTYEATLQRLPEVLGTEGFGVLTEVDVKETLKKKLGVDFRRYKILGACNPPLALRALEAKLEVGRMLPCNLIVYEADDGLAAVVAVDPMQTIAAQANSEVRAVAAIVREKLSPVLDRLE